MWRSASLAATIIRLHGLVMSSVWPDFDGGDGKSHGHSRAIDCKYCSRNCLRDIEPTNRVSWTGGPLERPRPHAETSDGPDTPSIRRFRISPSGHFHCTCGQQQMGLYGGVLVAERGRTLTEQVAADGRQTPRPSYSTWCSVQGWGGLLGLTLPLEVPGARHFRVAPAALDVLYSASFRPGLRSPRRRIDLALSKAPAAPVTATRDGPPRAHGLQETGRPSGVRLIEVVGAGPCADTRIRRAQAPRERGGRSPWRC
jgi:hypothetical protein